MRRRSQGGRGRDAWNADRCEASPDVARHVGRASTAQGAHRRDEASAVTRNVTPLALHSDIERGISAVGRL
ncbi:hypothetical protein ACFPM0_33685 [Pseudonocardia sulfidoxydans]|uniref:hypothetical protein n=1 Tax=Pseudonocardia sulfidoxydans TaxID=54011 RepID=UPI00360B1554